MPPSLTQFLIPFGFAFVILAAILFWIVHMGNKREKKE